MTKQQHLRPQGRPRQPPSPNPNVRHLHILLFIYDYSQQQGRGPTIREIGKAVGIGSTSLVDYNLMKLEQWRYLERSRHSTRGVRLLEAGYRLIDKSSPQAVQEELARLRRENRDLRAECQRLQRRHSAVA